ncbi:MAG: hypothetical protein LBI57_06385 [Helicobacteraceae bacterium]|nr:hypothetical protein [Helicobacteraceae bacterium]
MILAIDLGSNAIRFLAIDRRENALWEAQFVVKTAENLARSGEIGQDALSRIAAAIAEAKERFDFNSCHIVAVATEAFRRAKNRRAAIAFLRENCGVNFKIISAETEAKLTAAATARSARQKGLKEPFISLDIGGASSEIVYINGDMFRYISLPIGVVTIAENKFDDLALERFLNDELEAIKIFRQNISNLPRAQTLIATAGAPTTLAAVKLGLTRENYDKHIVNKTALSKLDIVQIRKALMSLEQAELEKFTGADRGDLVIVGAAALHSFLTALDYERTIVFDEGLREGAAANALQRLALA